MLRLTRFCDPLAGRSWALVGIVMSTAVLGAGGCQYDDSDWQRDQDSGATSSRGSSSSTGATGGKGQAGSTTSHAGSSGSGNAGSTGDAGGSSEPTGGASDPPAEYPEPSIDSMEPASGAYGTLVTIKGHGLGNPSLSGFTLAIGNQGEVTITPKDQAFVSSWTDEEIVFRFPFPAEGGVSLEAPQGAVLAGEFQPSWHIAREIDKAPAESVLASIVSAPDHLTLLFDTDPLTLLDIGPDGAVEHSVTAGSVDPSSLRLYLNSAKKVEAIGVSTDAAPVLVQLQNQDDDLVAKATSIKLDASEFSVAGGSEGAAVWMRRSNGWYRARPGASAWSVDKGPVADASPDAPDRASGASSDGSLYVGWSIDTGNFLDDMEAAQMAKLAPTATKFAAATAAGSSVDDYVTSLSLTSSGDGLVVTTCGSDVDPFGLSGTDRYCFDALHAPSGAHIFGVPVDQGAMAHAFTHSRAVVAYCTGDNSWLIRTDTDVETTPGAALGETVLYPCPEAVALEVDGAGDFVPVVRWEGKAYLLERTTSQKTSL
jgi:IPT/TIG domain-containing protein